MQTKSFKKKKDSDEESDDYELPAEHYFETRFVSNINSNGKRAPRQRVQRKQMTEEQMDKIIDKDSSETEDKEEKRESLVKDDDSEDSIQQDEKVKTKA